MQIDDKLLDHLMGLAALELPPQRRELLRSQLERVLDYASQLPPLPETAAGELEDAQAPRPDEVVLGFEPQQVRAIVPAHEGDFIRVPPVLSGKQS